LRQRTRALIIAVRRGTTLLDHPDPEQPLQAGDVVYITGSGEAIRSAMALLETGGRPDAI
jgi:K+/H+ antiporter YhaU regulatory subunit KhtT